MAFWGIEVKPGSPYSLNNQLGRLHISQATLGISHANKKSLVQCNIGNKKPAILCCLLPNQVESCALNLEFEEVEQVIFSVLGPGNVHLTGYYPRSNLNDHSESYGEDIADTETEKSNDYSTDDEYGGSFINDSDPEVFSSSSVSSGDLMVEKKIKDKRSKNGKAGWKRLKKKFQVSESDEEISSQHKNNAKSGAIIVEVLESADEDKMVISSLHEKGDANLEEQEEKKKKKNKKSKKKRKKRKMEMNGDA